MDNTGLKKMIAYGAGNIGRGFVGQLFYESGYEVVFVDVNKALVDKLNVDGRYPVRVVSSDETREIWIENVRAIDGSDIEAVSSEIVSSDIMCTAVGVNILPKIVGPISKGLRKRWGSGNTSAFNIIICENMIGSAGFLRELFIREMTADERRQFSGSVGLVEASIGRMVPVMTEKMQEGNILRVWVEEYCMFPVDKDGFRGEIPDIRNLVPYSPFSFYIQRKLFIHNLGHAVTAYLGYLSGYEYVWEASRDRIIRHIAMNAMGEAATALSKEHRADRDEIMDHAEDLMERFGNRQLGDTVIRVGGDPVRKLSPNDRLAGAAALCLKHGIMPYNICVGIWAALQFYPPEDKSAARLKEMVEKDGSTAVLKELCGIGNDSPLLPLILGYETDHGRQV